MYIPTPLLLLKHLYKGIISRLSTEPKTSDVDLQDGQCSNRVHYKMYSNRRINTDVVKETQERSTTECATKCSHVVTCQAFSFHVTDNMCELHSGRTDTMVKSRDFRAGVKTCIL